MINKLDLPITTVAECRQYAHNTAQQVQQYIDLHSTVAVERTICRLMGIDDVNAMDVPLPNVVVEHLENKGILSQGVAYCLGNAILEYNLSPQQIALAIDKGEIDLSKTPTHNVEQVYRAVMVIANKTANVVKHNVATRNQYLSEYGDKKGPYIYLIVATGNIYEDIIQAKAAAKQGADVIAVIRTTGQSLLDYVPYGATTDGFGGTYATQENFRLMRQALDEVGQSQNRYIRLCNYCSGLCMPEIAAMGALERLDMMLNDALYGILFRDINMKRTMVDQYFSRLINAYAEVIINTGEDNYLTTADAVEEAHTIPQ